MSAHTSDAFIHGELRDKKILTSGEAIHIGLTFKVEEVEAGYTERVPIGEDVLFHVSLPIEMKGLFDEMSIGKRYFVRGTFYHTTWHPLSMEKFIPMLGVGFDFSSYHLKIKPFGAEKLWFLVSKEDGELDFDSLGLSDELAQLQENQRGIFVRTTVDMTAQPHIYREFYRLIDGRLIDAHDELKGNQVVVVSLNFARERGLSVGDTLSLTLRDLPEFDEMGILRSMVTWETYPTYQLELEIVGLFRCMSWFEHSYRYIYVPESIIPSEFKPENPIIYDGMFSFILTSAREQQRFLEENEEKLRILGYEIVFIEHGAEQLWAVVDPALHAGRVNLIAFSGVFVIVLTLLSVLSLHSWRRYFAILRALGCPARRVFLQMFIFVGLVWLPALLIGSVVGRYIAISKAYETMTPALEMLSDKNFTGSFSVFHTLVLWMILAAVTMIIFSFIAFVITRKSTLLLLQGVGRCTLNKKRKGFRQKSFDSLSYQNEDGHQISLVLAENRFKTNEKHERKAIRRQLYRNILRLPAKSILTISLALVLLISIGLLNEAINESVSEIDYLYNTTVVTAQIGAMNREDYIWHFWGIIDSRFVEMVVNTGFIDSIYLEGRKARTYLVPNDENISISNDIWSNLDGFGAYDNLFGFSDIEVFLHRNRERWLDMPPGATMAINEVFLTEETLVDFELVTGFGIEDFIFYRDAGREQIIPVIVGEYILNTRGLSLGDTAQIISSFTRRIYEVYIIGTADGFMMGDQPEKANSQVFIPIATLELLQGNPTMYTTAIFELDSTRNRELSEFKEYLERIEVYSRTSIPRLRFDLQDEELKAVVEQLEQTLLLLQVLFPIVMGVSMLISFGLSLLLNLQKAKSVAIMRTLGVQKSIIHRLFIIEQAILCITGLLCGWTILLLLERKVSLDFNLAIFTILYFLAVLFGSAVGATITINRSPLDLLQEKE